MKKVKKTFDETVRGKVNKELREELDKQKKSHAETSKLYHDSVSKSGGLISEIMVLREHMDVLKEAIVVSFVKRNSKPESKTGIEVSSNVWMIDSKKDGEK